MRLSTITTFAVAGQLVALAIAKPIPNWTRKADGIAIPLARHSSSLPSNETIDLDAIGSHAISVREKILRGLDNYEMNTGTKHPFAVKRNESELGRRGTGIPLTTSPSHRGDIWMGEISFGTPSKPLTVQIDTGSADTWVLEIGCDGIPGDRDLWDPFSSDTAYGGSPFRLAYADNTIVQGNRYTDKVTVAGFTADQTFGSVTSYMSTVQENAHSDGLLGLAFRSISKFGVEPVFGSLVAQNRLTLTNPAFSLKLGHSGAELYVGGANTEMYHGDITYTHVTTPGHWQVSMDDVTVDGRKILEHLSVIFDTGSDFIFGDWDRVSEICETFGGTLKEHGSIGYCESPCDSFPRVVFTFSGKPFEISAEYLNIGTTAQNSPSCFNAIVADRSYTASGFWVIGLAFLRGIYTVFDYGNLQVGFAELA